MAYDVKLIGAKLRRWENYLNNFHLPQWDELPDMDLYMDQVVMLLQRYLNFLPEDEHGNAAITASIINNYVRLKIMPPPVKKKYTRVHMAYLIMVCSLKQSVNIPYIQKMLPLGLPEAEVRRIYEGYVKTHHDVCLAFIQLVRSGADVVLHQHVNRETDRYNCQGTTSSTSLGVIFHVLQTILIEETGFKNEQFALIHPGGAVGERLNNK